MVSALIVISAFIKLVDLLILLLVFYYAYKIYYLTTDSKRLWVFIAVGFVLIIVRRAIHFSLPFMNENALKMALNWLEASILLLSTLFFFYAFYKLNELCERIVNRKIQKSNSRK